jgi:hypothetical protein
MDGVATALPFDLHAHRRWNVGERRGICRIRRLAIVIDDAAAGDLHRRDYVDERQGRIGDTDIRHSNHAQALAAALRTLN